MYKAFGWVELNTARFVVSVEMLSATRSTMYVCTDVVAGLF